MNNISEREKSALTVLPEEAGERLDKVLCARWPEHSRAFFQQCITGQMVFVNHQKCTPARRLVAGDRIDLLWPTRAVQPLQAEAIPLDILYEDADILVLNKQAGLVVHPAGGNLTGTLVQGLLHHDSEAFEDMVDASQRPGIVHRLDKDTSGVLVVARHQESWQALKLAFKNRETGKRYLAIVAGQPADDQGSIDGAIGRHPVNRLKMDIVDTGGKEALSRYRVLARGQGCALLEVQIMTGRTHQIRVHLSSRGLPVLGDALYGGKPDGLPCAPPRQMLHAWKLRLPHPISGDIMLFTAPPPDDFRQTLAALGLSMTEG